MYSESASPWVSWTRGLTRAVCQQRTKYSSCKYLRCESASLWVRESVSPWVCESTSLWVRESVSLWVRESVSPRVHESTSQQSTEYIRPTDSAKRPTIHLVPLSSGHSGSTLSGGTTHHKFCACFSPPTFYCCAHLCQSCSKSCSIYFRPEASQPPLCYCAVVGITLAANIHGVLKFTWVLLFRNSFDRYLYSWYL